MIFDWITKRVSAAVQAGFADALEREGPHFRAEPGPPAIEAAAEQQLLSEPATNGKRLKLTK